MSGLRSRAPFALALATLATCALSVVFPAHAASRASWNTALCTSPPLVSDPTAIVTTSPSETVVRKELHAFPCYGLTDGAADILYSHASHGWTFDTPAGIDAGSITGAFVRVSLLADNQSLNSPPVSAYTLDVALNGSTVFSGAADVAHGMPLNACMNYTQWTTHDFPLTTLQASNVVSLTNTSELCPANLYWLGVDWIELHIPTPPCAHPSLGSDPSVTITSSPSETVVRKQLNAYPCYGQEDGAADIVYSHGSQAWSLDLPAGFAPANVEGAFFRVSLLADNQSSNSPPTTSYMMAVAINDATAYSGPANVQHGTPLNACMNYTQWAAQDFPIATLLGTNTLTLTNTSDLCPANLYWLGVDWIELHLPTPACTAAPVTSSPPATVVQGGGETIVRTELNGYGCYGMVDGAADILYSHAAHSWTLDVPAGIDVGSVTGAYVRVSLLADNQSLNSPPTSAYTLDVSLNGVSAFAGPANVEHGLPLNACMNYTQWSTHDFPLTTLLASNIVTLTNTSDLCPANLYWLGVDWIELHIPTSLCTSPSLGSDPASALSFAPHELILRQELDGYPCYGQGDGAADILYSHGARSWSFTVPDDINPAMVSNAFFRASLLADNQSLNSPPVSAYTLMAAINGTTTYLGSANVEHGMPLNQCMNYSQWSTHDFPVPALARANTITLTNTSDLCPANLYWLGVDWIELHIPYDGTTGIGPSEETAALGFRVQATTPVRATARLAITLGQPASVAVRVHDLSGRLVRRLDTADLTAGVHTVAWDLRDGHGRAVPAGLYVCDVSAGSLRRTTRIMVVR